MNIIIKTLKHLGNIIYPQTDEVAVNARGSNLKEVLDDTYNKIDKKVEFTNSTTPDVVENPSDKFLMKGVQSLSTEEQKQVQKNIGAENGIEPNYGYLRTLYESAGAKWLAPNKWELNGVQLTDEEINFTYAVSGQYHLGSDQKFRFAYNNKLKTNFCMSYGSLYPSMTKYLESLLDYSRMFFQCRNIEVIKLSSDNEVTGVTPNRALSMFGYCNKLKKIIGLINMDRCTTEAEMFYECYLLESVNINGLNISLGIFNSPLISKESILFLIEHHAATPEKPIVVTLHPDAYARLANDSDILAAIAAHPNISLAQA